MRKIARNMRRKKSLRLHYAILLERGRLEPANQGFTGGQSGINLPDFNKFIGKF